MFWNKKTPEVKLNSEEFEKLSKALTDLSAKIFEQGAIMKDFALDVQRLETSQANLRTLVTKRIYKYAEIEKDEQKDINKEAPKYL